MRSSLIVINQLEVETKQRDEVREIWRNISTFLEKSKQKTHANELFRGGNRVTPKLLLTWIERSSRTLKINKHFLSAEGENTTVKCD